MRGDSYHELLYKLDWAVVRIAHANATITAQEERLALAKDAGRNIGTLQQLLDTMRDTLRLFQANYERILLEVDVGPKPLRRQHAVNSGIVIGAN